MKSFHLKRALGLALGESWPLLAQPQKNTGVQCLPVFATKTSPQGAPLPTDHSIYNIYDSA